MFHHTDEVKERAWDITRKQVGDLMTSDTEEFWSTYQQILMELMSN
jgi:hypothetical protein